MDIQLTLLDNSQDQGRLLTLPQAEVRLYPALFDGEQSTLLLDELLHTIAWKAERIILYGKPVALPRLTAWYGDRGRTYTYSHLTLDPQPWTPTLTFIKSKVEALCQTQFNSVLLNLYRTGQDSVAWHSDDEPELGKNPVIGSVSFGETRRFQLRHRHDPTLRAEIPLTHGSGLLMQGTTQHYWQHQIPKTRRSHHPRINLTFRKILTS